MKYYRAAEIVPQLYMNVQVLEYHLKLPKTWILRVKTVLHNISAFLQSFYSDSVMNTKAWKKRKEGQTFAKNIQILVASGYASNIKFP